MIPSEQTSPSLSELSDRELMEAIAGADARALDALMDRHWATLLQYGSRMLGCPDEAKDIVQEVFVRVWEHRSRWQPGGSVRAYLVTIARNLVLLRGRHQDVRTRTEPQVRRLAGRPATPLEHMARSELQDAFEDAFEALPPRRKEAFVLVRFQGYSLREASEVMGVTRRTIANQVYQASTALRDALAPFLA